MFWCNYAAVLDLQVTYEKRQNSTDVTLRVDSLSAVCADDAWHCFAANRDLWQSNKTGDSLGIDPELMDCNTVAVKEMCPVSCNACKQCSVGTGLVKPTLCHMYWALSMWFGFFASTQCSRGFAGCSCIQIVAMVTWRHVASEHQA
jgi:hypothetical protein